MRKRGKLVPSATGCRIAPGVVLQSSGSSLLPNQSYSLIDMLLSSQCLLIGLFVVNQLQRFLVTGIIVVNHLEIFGHIV